MVCTRRVARWDTLQLVTGTEQSALVWNLDVESWPETACRTAGSNLSQAEWDIGSDRGGRRARPPAGRSSPVRTRSYARKCRVVSWSIYRRGMNHERAPRPRDRRDLNMSCDGHTRCVILKEEALSMRAPAAGEVPTMAIVILKFDSTRGATPALSALRAIEEMRYARADDIARSSGRARNIHDDVCNRATP